MTNPLIFKTACALLLSTTLAACGGGSGGSGGDSGTAESSATGSQSSSTPANNGTSNSSTSTGTDAGNNTSESDSSSATNNGGTGNSNSAGGSDANDSDANTSDANDTGVTDNSGSNSGAQAGAGTGHSSGSPDTSSSDTSDTGNSADGAASASQYASWDATSVYNAGDRVSFEGNIYEAKWWTQNHAPSDNNGSGKPWKLIGSDDANTDNTASDDDEGSNDAGNADDANLDQDTDQNGNSGNASRPAGQVVGTYFVEWGIYGRDYHVMDMPAEKLTHILYGFIPICGPNESLQQANPSGYSALVSQCEDKQDYEVTIHDKFAAIEKSYPGDKWDDEIRGNFGQLIKLKQQHPHLKVLPSIGGWTLSDPFFYLATDDARRKIFVDSVADFLRAYPLFDGVDIDWEFPGGRGANANLGSQADFEGYADLMRDLRAMLDTLEGELGKELELSSAIGTSPAMVAAANYGRAHQYMDYIFAMTYDYHGAWSGVLGHQTALNDYHYNSSDGFYAASVLDSLLMQNVPASKIVLGAAMYGRGWSNITGAQPEWPFSGQGNAPVRGSWEDGVIDYKDIVENYLGGTQGSGINGFTYYYDADAEAPYLWNYNSGTLITYDNPRSVKAKAAFVKNNGLGGLFSWEIDGDNGDIVDAMIEGLSE